LALRTQQIKEDLTDKELPINSSSPWPYLVRVISYSYSRSVYW